MVRNGENSVVLSQGINLRDLVGSNSVFQIDPDFAEAPNRVDPMLYDELVLDGNDSEGEDVMKTLKTSTEKLLLAAPQYLSFDDLATKMIDVIPSGHVKILIVEEGSGNLLPDDAYVHVHYAAYWENQKIPFDNTLAWNNGAPARLKMGGGAILPGLEIGLTAVKGPRAQFQLLLTPEVLWGKQGALPRIRPERALFCVTLVSVEDLGPVDRFTSLPSEDQKKFSVTLETVEAANLQAKNFFAKHQYLKAIRNYHMSLSVLQLSEPMNDKEMEKIKLLMCKVYVNLAISYSKMECPKKVLLMCDELARITPINQHCQALYLYGKAFFMLGELQDSQKFLKKALKLQPKNPDIAREMVKVDKKIVEAKQQEKRMWKGAFTEKAAEKEFNVDNDFKNELQEICEGLTQQQGYTEFKLPKRITDDEIAYAKNLLEGFENLSLSEHESHGIKKVAIVKKQ